MTIAEAAFVMVADPLISDARREALEDAMIAAIVQAQAEGITDPNVIRERIIAARDAMR